MNPINFFNDNFSVRVGITPGNDPVAAAERAITKNHIINGKPLRLTHAWFVIRQGQKPHTNVKLDPELFEIEGQGRSAYKIFHETLANWGGEPVMLVHIPGKRGMEARELAITHDPRAARICTPTGIITFDFTTPPSTLAPKAELIIKAVNKK
jgi:hypothetical protein